ncbi:MAG: acyl-CoA thioesterase [Deltaproteobacteria bacterium]|nr:acyl-CoA thioesterase [Deltaproteobacteria bacterium]
MKTSSRRLRPGPDAVVAEVEVLVPFHDADPMNVVWHGNYFKYFEMARTALEKRLGLTVTVLNDMGYICPVIESHCRHVSAMRYGDVGRCRAWVAAMDRRVTVAYELWNMTTGRRSAEGYTVQAALDRDTREMLLEVPEGIARIVRKAAGVPLSGH